LAALQDGNAIVGPLIQGFSLLAIATSFIGFILGLTDFLVDGLKLPNRQAPLPYAITLLPPFAVAVTNPDIFLQALDTAGEMPGDGRCVSRELWIVGGGLVAAL
jgi:tyrosine-specific transport protein